MKRLLLILLLYFSPTYADPFYPDEAEKTKVISSTRSSTNFTACKPSEKVNTLYLPFDLQQAKLVGIVKIADQFRALFSHQQQLFDVKIGDYFATTGIQIIQIDFKSVTLIDWQNSEFCHQPNYLQLTL